MSEGRPFPVLRKPPIVEVVCGVHFNALPLDGLVLGVYWDRRSDEFPERHLQPALSDAPQFILGSPPVRAVLVGSDKVHVLQLQHDRFFMNWRAVGKSYPRFSNRGGNLGLMSKAIEEFNRYSAFCKERFHEEPVPSKIELAKIDMLTSKEHWTDLEDLVRVLPLAGTFGHAGHHGTREFAVRFVEQDAPTDLIVSVNSVTDRPGHTFGAVRIETRAITPVTDGSIEDAFRTANSIVNGAFFKLLSEAELGRFEPTGEAS